MNEPGQAIDFSQTIASLRLMGADKFDPIGLYYLEALAHRTTAQRSSVKRILDDKLKHSLDNFERSFRQAQSAASVDTAQNCDGPRESLRDLTRRITQHSEAIGAPAQGNIGSRAELKSVRQFRNTWSKLSANKQVTQALDQTPKNAGPINSHMLVLRSLALMRDNHPDYLNRFVSYVDTLLSLDQGNKDKRQ